MAKLEAMQRLADREAKKLGVQAQLTVQWGGASTCKLGRFQFAHAHNNKRFDGYGLICVRRGLKDWRDTIKHEVAHFVPGGRHDGLGFLRARAKQGSKAAKSELRTRRKMRCPKHQWMKGSEMTRTVTQRGLVVTYDAQCAKCGKSIP